MRDSKLYHIMLQKLGDVEKVLDVGCGEGKLVTFVAKRKKQKIIGVDISELGFHKAREEATKVGISHLITCMKCDAHKIEECLKGKRFEAVTMTCTLHHLKKPTVALREIRKILFPKGKILIADWVLDGVRKEGECNKFALRGIQRMLKKAGYRLLTTEELERGLALFEAENLTEPKVMRS